MNKITLTPFGRNVARELTLAQVLAEMQPATMPCEQIVFADICKYWRMSEAERLEQLQLVADMKKRPAVIQLKEVLAELLEQIEGCDGTAQLDISHAEIVLKETGDTQ